MKNGKTPSEPQRASTAELTELERVKMENFALKHQAIQQQQQANLQARAAFVRQIEAAHPGYKWNDQRGLVLEEAANAVKSHSAPTNDKLPN